MAGERLLAQGEKRRKHMLRFIRSYVKKNGRPPTIAEIASEVDLKSPNATRNHLLWLEETGFIKLTPRVSRGIALVDPAPDGWTAHKVKIAS